MDIAQYLPILLIVGLIIFFVVYKKNKKKKELAKTGSNRKEKDEVWQTIKAYIRDHHINTKGEIVDHYVVKRNNIDYISPHVSRYIRKKQRAVVDIRKMQNGNKYVPANNLEQYVVCFQTQDIKTKKYNPPQAFECEVVTTRISKKETKQKIVITKSLDFDTEMEWIAPLRSIEQKKNAQAQKILEKEKIKQEKIKAKKELKESKKVQKAGH